jgi:hypothetical protein
MLDRWEQRRLRGIERVLETDDPAFAERFTATPERSHPNGAKCRMNVLMIVGTSLTLVGLLTHPLVVAVGVSIALTGLWIRIGMAWIERAQQRADKNNTEDDAGDDAEDDSGGEAVPT